MKIGMTYIVDDAKVLEFLYQHPDLLLVLAEAIPHLEKLFSPVSVVLQMGNKKLWGYIQTDLPVEDAIECLWELDNVWFLGQAERVKDLFNFNLR